MKRASRSLLVCAVVSAALTMPAFAAESHMRDGQWEITTKIEMPGMPVSIPPITVTRCLTKEDVDNPNKTVPSATKSDACKVKDYKVDGSKITWSLQCDEKSGGLAGTGEMTVKDDSYEGAMKMTTQGQDMSIKFSGKRSGDCK